MNEQHKIVKPEPVLIRRNIIEEYEQHYKEMVKRSWDPGSQAITCLGMAIEAEYVLTQLFGVSGEVINNLNKEAMNECKTDSRDVPNQE